MKKTLSYLLLSLSLLVLSGCQSKSVPKGPEASQMTPTPDSTAEVTTQPFPIGAVEVLTVSSPDSASVVKERLLAIIESNPNVNLVKEIPHSENAKKQGLELSSSSVFVFGNPKVGTPLMKANPSVAIDLPQKFLLLEKDGKASLNYNSTDYLASRHGIEKQALEPMKTALAKLSLAVTKGEAEEVAPQAMALEPGFLRIETDRAFDEVAESLSKTLSEHPKLRLMLEMDHQANAKSVGLELHPCKLFIFGNPKIGTPLMSEQASLALDLPQKILVYRDDQGQTILLANDPFYLAKRHGLLNQDQKLGKIKAVLEKLMNGAATS